MVVNGCGWLLLQVNLPELQPGGAKHLGFEPDPPQYGGSGYNAWPFSISKFKVSCRRYWDNLLNSSKA